MKNQTLLRSFKCPLSHKISEKCNEQILGNFRVFAFFGAKLSYSLTLFSMGLFEAAHRWGRAMISPTLPKICHTYTTMVKLGTIIPYLKKIQKTYESCDTLFEVCWDYLSFHRKSITLVISRNTVIDCILIHNF